MGRGAVYACKMFFCGNISREDGCPQCECHSVRMYLLSMWGSRGWEQFPTENMAFRGVFLWGYLHQALHGKCHSWGFFSAEVSFLGGGKGLLRGNATSQRPSVLGMIFRVRGEFLIGEGLPMETINPWKCVSLRGSLRGGMGIRIRNNLRENVSLGCFLGWRSTHGHVSPLGYLCL